MPAPAILAAAAALLLAVTGCSSANPTPIFVYTTATPAPSTTPTPVVEPTATLAPTDAPTAAPTDTPTATHTPVPASPTPAGSPTPIPTPGPAAGCTGGNKPANAAFWVGTANNVPFAIYCGVTPSPWYFNGASSAYGATGKLTSDYKTSGGADFALSEGTFGAAAHGASIGSASFGDQSGTLYAGTSGGFVLLVAPGTSHAYQAVGSGLTQAVFVSLSAALMKVAKS
jgi:hypothetical protein